MNETQENTLVDDLILLIPAYRARKFAHEAGIPWERVGALQALLEIYAEPALGALGDNKQVSIEHEYDGAERLLTFCGSPIEELFVTYLGISGPDWRWVEDNAAQHRITGARIELQFPIEKFKIDVAITSSTCMVAVELDGHEWHERSKAQAAKDKSRDRRLQELGWKVLRFTGSEVWADPRKCVAEAFRIAGVSTK